MHAAHGVQNVGRAGYLVGDPEHGHVGVPRALAVALFSGEGFAHLGVLQTVDLVGVGKVVVQHCNQESDAVRFISLGLEVPRRDFSV